MIHYGLSIALTQMTYSFEYGTSADKTSRKPMMKFKTLIRRFWGRHMLERGYFAINPGNVSYEVIMQYIEQQRHEPPDGDLKIDGHDL